MFAAFVSLMVVLLIVSYHNFFKKIDPVAPPTITPSPTTKANLGQLILELTPPARASLNNFHNPDDGTSVAATHYFSDLEPKTYQLTVKREGYKTYTQIITIGSGITKLQINLKEN